MAAYKDAISNTSMDLAPWYIIPANRKWFRDLAISEIMTETLASLAIPCPIRPLTSKSCASFTAPKKR